MPRAAPALLPDRLLRCGWLLLVLLSLCVALPQQADAQALPLSGLTGSDEEQEEHDPQAFLESLDEVIATLEDASRRGTLVESLRELREAAAQAEGEEPTLQRQGLLGALADTLSDFGDQAEAGQSPLDVWQTQFDQALSESLELLDEASSGELMRLAIEATVMLGIWVGLLIILMAAARLVAQRHDWPLRLPREPRAWQLIIHLLRRLLPWLLAFLIMLGVGQFVPESAGRTLALVVAYVALCGRLLAVIVEVVMSAFTRGHRFVAVSHLRQRALRRLFAIGALVALADALESGYLIELLGGNLSSLLSVLANILAALLAGSFVMRFKRPIKHLIRNRPYAQRHRSSTSYDLIWALGGLWHVPALLMVGASLLAIFISVGDAGGALTRAIISASLLVLTLVVTGLIRRHGETVTRRKRISQYRKRLERFGYALAHMVCWVAFGELSLQVWGGSLLGLGQQGVASARIGQALVAIGVTMLLAWLAWIFADTAIQRALSSSARARGRRVNSARAQTITPLIRNVIFATIVVIAAIVGLANLGVNVTPLLAGAGVIGLAIGFGAQTLVQDLITGIFILIEDSLAIDDFVDLGGHLGTVEGLTLRTVRLRDLDGIVHIITFSQIQSIHNMSRQFGIALMRVRIPHAMKIDDAISLVREVADELRQDPMMRHHIWSPLELQGVERFEEGAAVLRMRMRTAPVMQWDVARAFNLRLKQRMEEDGLDMAMPRMSIQMEGRLGETLDEGQGETPDAPQDSAGREPGEAGVADPEGETSPSGGSPSSAPSR
ncbi:mechanosensitive ion channel family protein [Franzmannia qiaohouensis]|uniref:Mechanosensitive ion channel family protein n=1 Tax=Franzmannia qiaohouensis TaxID=1329370 RepID=A0ABU1HIV9_9GAMM|nr:mechanosensitive ion channel family protein [Halomonas qiaohouensis]MDR5906968.1 mechanosensitive ion channel family protein [Halomonas qiaohouensis]